MALNHEEPVALGMPRPMPETSLKAVNEMVKQLKHSGLGAPRRPGSENERQITSAEAATVASGASSEPGGAVVVMSAQEKREAELALQEALRREQRQKSDEEILQLMDADVLETRANEARWLRLQFCLPTMLRDDGTGEFNTAYFEPTGSLQKARVWGEAQKNKLLKLMEKHPMGKWAPYVAAFKDDGDWSATELRVKCSRLLGSQSVKFYDGWTGTKADVEAEYQKNYEVGVKFGQWKSGTLVHDDDGQVVAYLENLAEESKKRSVSSSSSSSSSLSKSKKQKK